MGLWRRGGEGAARLRECVWRGFTADVAHFDACVSWETGDRVMAGMEKGFVGEGGLSESEAYYYGVLRGSRADELDLKGGDCRYMNSCQCANHSEELAHGKLLLCYFSDGLVHI
jgi:hypothetical protein